MFSAMVTRGKSFPTYVGEQPPIGTPAADDQLIWRDASGQAAASETNAALAARLGGGGSDAAVAGYVDDPVSLTTVALAAQYLSLVAGGASVENVGAIESNVQTVGATGATETLDTATYGVFDMTMDQACEFTFSNPAPSGKNTTFVLVLRGAFTPTLPASVDWSGGVAPTYTTPSVYVFTTVDAGTTWLGSQVGAAFA
jgi:hypothetical protein